MDKTVTLNCNGELRYLQDRGNPEYFKLVILSHRTNYLRKYVLSLRGEICRWKTCENALFAGDEDWLS